MSKRNNLLPPTLDILWDKFGYSLCRRVVVSIVTEDVWTASERNLSLLNKLSILRDLTDGLAVCLRHDTVLFQGCILAICIEKLLKLKSSQIPHRKLTDYSGLDCRGCLSQYRSWSRDLAYKWANQRQRIWRFQEMWAFRFSRILNRISYSV